MQSDSMTICWKVQEDKVLRSYVIVFFLFCYNIYFLKIEDNQYKSEISSYICLDH